MSRVGTIIVLGLLAAGQHAAAQTATVINLSWDGKAKNGADGEEELIRKMGLVVNFAERTVIGFGTVARIDDVDAATISFSGKGPLVYRGSMFGTLSATGAVDRITGAVTATTIQISDATKKIVTTLTYDLVCKVTSRLFQKRENSLRP